jgi:phosphoenolpyruvate carboxylase
MGRVPAARRAGGGASEKEARITYLKLWELLNSEREDRITETTSVIPSRRGARLHTALREYSRARLTGLLGTASKFETDCRGIRAINRTDFGPLGARAAPGPALPQLIVVLHRGIEIKGEVNRAIQ